MNGNDDEAPTLSAAAVPVEETVFNVGEIFLYETAGEVLFK